MVISPFSGSPGAISAEAEIRAKTEANLVTGSTTGSTAMILVAIAGLPLVGETLIVSPRLTNRRSEEHTSELQSLMRISYAVFCLKNKTHNTKQNTKLQNT